ncbi:hypothetical protein ACPA9J_02685 [Pseudomonas aeruginosa]
MRTARTCTTCRSERQRVRRRPAYRGGAAGRWPGRSGAAGSAASMGAKHRAAGIARRGFPLEASEARSAAGAKA